MSTHLKPLFSLALASGLVLACQPKTGQEAGGMPDSTAVATPDAGAVRADLQGMNEKWVAAAKAGDAAAMTALYTDDAIVIAPGQPAGPAGTVISSMLQQAKFENMDISIGQMAVADSGDLAYITGPYHDTGTLSDGSKFDSVGQYATVFKKVAGEWKIVLDTWNEQAPAQ